MTRDQAILLAEPHKKGASTLAVTSDGQVYINGDLTALKAHAEAENLEFFPIVGVVKEPKKTKENAK